MTNDQRRQAIKELEIQVKALRLKQNDLNAWFINTEKTLIPKIHADQRKLLNYEFKIKKIQLNDQRKELKTQIAKHRAKLTDKKIKLTSEERVKKLEEKYLKQLLKELSQKSIQQPMISLQ